MRSTSERSHTDQPGAPAPEAGALHLPRNVANLIVEHAANVQPLECCGILIGRRDGDATLVERCVAAENIADEDRRTSYQIDWQSLFRAFRATGDENATVVGFYHSHPDGSTSPSDRDHAEAWADHSYVIVSLRVGQQPQITSWRGRDEGSGLAMQSVHIEEGPAECDGDRASR